MPKEIKDAEEYRDWIAAHTGVGFVANLIQDKNSSTFTIHSSDCPEIKTIGGKGGSGGDKIVSLDYRKLVNWGDSEHPGIEIRDHARKDRRCMDCDGAQRENPYYLDRVFFFMAPLGSSGNWRDKKRGLATNLSINPDRLGRYRPGDYLVLVEGGRSLGIYGLGKIVNKDKKVETVIESELEPVVEAVIDFSVKQVRAPLLKDDLDKRSEIRCEDKFPGHWCKLKELDSESPQDHPLMFPDTSYTKCKEALPKVLMEKGLQEHHHIFELPNNRVSFRQWEVLKTEFSGCDLRPGLLHKD